MFIIAAALMLMALLFKLGVDQRATELGILLGVGFRHAQLRRMLLVEAGVVTGIGAAVGAVAGVGYAWLMLVGLKTWWLGAISTPFLQLFVVPQTLAIGFGCGLVVSLVTIVWATRQIRRTSVRQLLSGHVEENRPVAARHKRIAPWLAEALVVAALGVAIAAVYLRGDARALPFFGAGAGARGAFDLDLGYSASRTWSVACEPSIAAITAGVVQRRAEAAKKHADDWFDCHGQFSHRWPKRF